MHRPTNLKRFVLLSIALFFLNNSIAMTQVFPHTDPENNGNWVLNSSISDEFDGTEIDETKWQICGRDGIYWNTSATNPGFTGRGYAPDSFDTGWEFSPDNLRVENGLLKIKTEHNPNYPWVNNPNGWNFEYTTGGMYSKSTFTHGYMEVRCKLPATEQACAFWTTGTGVELDVFEAIGKHPACTDLLWSSVHDWTIPRPNSAWTETTEIPFEFSDGFHIYAAEWDESTVKIYADGQLIHSVTKEWIGSNGQDSMRWPMDAQQHVWVDSEIFPWWGKPTPADLPADYEIEYVRVWQKAPKLTQIELNVGENQRSTIESASVFFEGEVDLEPGAFSLVQRSTATEETFEEVAINVNEQFSDGQTIATILFDSHTRNAENALVDGNYQLTLNSELVTLRGVPMQEDHVFGDEEIEAFFSFFGDSNGDRIVDVIDLLALRQSYLSAFGDGNYNYAMDFQGNGLVNVADLLPFRGNYLKSIPFTFGQRKGLSLSPSQNLESHAHSKPNRMRIEPKRK